jgi:hypothetical protein
VTFANQGKDNTCLNSDFLSGVSREVRRATGLSLFGKQVRFKYRNLRSSRKKGKWVVYIKKFIISIFLMV